MTARRAMTPARKRRICAARNWTTPTGDVLALERGKVVTLRDGAGVEFDHVHQLAMGGADEDDNVRPLHPDDHKDKTRQDAQDRGSVRRLSGQNKPKTRKPWAPGRKMPSRPFPKRIKGD